MAEVQHEYEAGLPVGERLRRAREARGMTLEDVATRTRIPIRHLRSIEDSNWDELPAITYTVGFGRSYANAVGLDGAEIGRELRDQLGGATRPTQMSTEYYAPPDPARVPSRTMAWIAGALALLLVVGYLIWRSSIGEDEQAEATPAPVEQAQPVEPQQPQAPAAPADLTGQQVTLVAVEDAWVRIDDRARPGAALQQGILTAGQQYQVPATAQQPVIRTRRPQALRVRVGDRDLGQLGPEERLIANVSLLPNDLARMLQGQGASPGQATPAPGAAVAPGAAPSLTPPSANGFQPLL